MKPNLLSLLLITALFFNLPAYAIEQKWGQVTKNSLWYAYNRFVPCPIKHKVTPAINAASITRPLYMSNNQAPQPNTGYSTNAYVSDFQPSQDAGVNPFLK